MTSQRQQNTARRRAVRALETAALRAEYATSSLAQMAARRGISHQAVRFQLMVRGIARRPRGGDFRRWIGLAVPESGY